MSLIPLRAILRKDLRVFFSDRRAMITAFAMPIAIASFFGIIFRGQQSGNAISRIDVLVVNNDTGAIAASIVKSILADSNLAANVTTLDSARARVRRGAMPVAIVIPEGFGDAAGRAFFRGVDRPVIDVMYDPSHSTERAMVSGIMTQHVMEAVSREMFGGQRGSVLIDETLANLDSTGMSPERRALLGQMLGAVRNFNSGQRAAGNGEQGAPVGISMPYSMRAEPVTARANVSYNSFAHAFAGMGIQFLLMTAINLGVDMLLERQRGIWKRLRSSPTSRSTLLGGKLASASVIGALVLIVSFVFAIIVWKVRIDGSMIGFLGVAVSCAIMAAAYGLLIASLGKTPNTARGFAIMATLLMVMLGGAWVPTFIFPKWLQSITVAIPTRWAMDGFDAMTWRGLGLADAVAPIGVLLGFSALFLFIAVNRFRWEES